MQLLALCGGDNPIDDTQFPKWDVDLQGWIREFAKAPGVSKDKLDALLDQNDLHKGLTNAKAGKVKQLLDHICRIESE